MNNQEANNQNSTENTNVESSAAVSQMKAKASQEVMAFSGMNNSNSLQQFSHDELLRQANDLINSGILPRGYKTPESVLIAMKMAQDLGVPPTRGIYAIDVIQNVPTMSAKLITGLLQKNGVLIQTLKNWEPVVKEVPRVDKEGKPMRDKEGNVLTVEKVVNWVTELKFTRMYFGEKVSEIVQFTAKEASSLQYLDKDNWKKQPEVMAWNRALVKGARRFAADILLGFGTYYSTEEMLDTKGTNYNVTDDGEVVILD